MHISHLEVLATRVRGRLPRPAGQQPVPPGESGAPASYIALYSPILPYIVRGKHEALTLNERSFIILPPYVIPPARTCPRSPDPNPRCSPGLLRSTRLSPD